ncbi:hypothetical protein PQX77_002506 [Marasmius sp. AFHP31]|nr:hypothetical protein PQX77_002506 [Marasmius sp. AFHP31]
MPPVRSSSTMLSILCLDLTFGSPTQTSSCEESVIPFDLMGPPSLSLSPSLSSSPNEPIQLLNCFTLFRAKFCKESNLRGENHPGAQLSKRAAIAWNQLAPEENKPRKDLACPKKRQRKLEQKCAKADRSSHRACSASAGLANDAGSTRNKEDSIFFQDDKDGLMPSGWGAAVDPIINANVTSHCVESRPWSSLELHPLSVITPPASTSSSSAAPPTLDPDFSMSDETFLSCFLALTL